MMTKKTGILKRLIFLSLGGLSIATWARASTELAKINGKGITDTDLQKSLSSLPENQRVILIKDKNSRRQVLLSLIEQELVIMEGEKAKLDQETEYKEAISAFRRQYLGSKVLERNLANKLTTAASKKYFESHKNEYSTDQVYVQHILLPDEGTAKEILKKAREPGADFLALAEKFSKDTSAKNNRGDIGFIHRDSPFVPEFKNAAFNGVTGSIVGPIRTAYGYHILKVVKKKSGRILNFDEVELKVKGALQQELTIDYVAKLRDKAQITINDKALDGLPGN